MKTREAAVSGSFYPDDALEITAQFQQWLTPLSQRHKLPKALIVPHAGYFYSGQVAAQAYRLLLSQAEHYNRVILAGPNHRVPLQGVAIPSVSHFETPLGQIPLDMDALAQLALYEWVEVYDEAHRQEHCLEVQLPFLQHCLKTFELVPLVIGEVSPKRVAELYEGFWQDDKTLIVISTDLSHFLNYDQAHRADELTLRRILSNDYSLMGEQACGCHALNGLLLSSEKHQLQPQLLAQCNSGDVTGDKTRVVGYASIALFEH